MPDQTDGEYTEYTLSLEAARELLSQVHATQMEDGSWVWSHPEDVFNLDELRERATRYVALSMEASDREVVHDREVVLYLVNSDGGLELTRWYDATGIAVFYGADAEAIRMDALQKRV